MLSQIKSTDGQYPNQVQAKIQRVRWADRQEGLHYLYVKITLAPEELLQTESSKTEPDILKPEGSCTQTFVDKTVLLQSVRCICNKSILWQHLYKNVVYDDPIRLSRCIPFDFHGR